MAIYIDNELPTQVSERWHWPTACHLFTDPGNEAELHAFAARIGIERRWYQEHGPMPHYDLNGRRRKAAVRLRATELDRPATVERIRAWRAAADSPLTRP